MQTSVPLRSQLDRYTRTAAPLHTVLVLAAVAAWAFRGWIHAGQARAVANPDRLAGYARTMLWEWLMFAFVILGVRLSSLPLSTILGTRWHSIRQVLRDIGIALAFWIVSTLVISIFGSHWSGAAPSRAVEFLLPRGTAEKLVWTALSITAGICEEMLYRGYLQRQFIAMTNNVSAGVLLAAVTFGAAHAYQGLRGAALIALQGAMLGILAHRRGSVRPGMIAHAWGDVFAGVLATALKVRVA